MSELRMVVKVKEDGTFQIPQEAIDALSLKPGDNVSVVERSGHIVLEKHIDHCVLCGSTENLVPPLYCVCDKCMEKIKAGHLMVDGMDF